MTQHAKARTSERILAEDVHSLSLTQRSHPGMWIDGGWPRARTESLAATDTVNVSVWEMTTGAVADVETDEILVVLSGAGTIWFPDGDEVELRPGVAIRLRGGEYAEWTVTSSLRALVITEVQAPTTTPHV